MRRCGFCSMADLTRYNWSPNPTQNANAVEFVPMQWNHVGIDDLPGKASSAKASTVIAFNEPELPDQSNMPVDLAVKEWIRCIEPMRKSGIRCGSPGISSAPQGVGWLKDFVRAIRAAGSDVDFYCIHWYGVDLVSTHIYLPKTLTDVLGRAASTTTFGARTISLAQTDLCGLRSLQAPTGTKTVRCRKAMLEALPEIASNTSTP